MKRVSKGIEIDRKRFITQRKQGFGKVMFSEVFVCSHGGDAVKGVP